MDERDVALCRAAPGGFEWWTSMRRRRRGEREDWLRDALRLRDLGDGSAVPPEAVQPRPGSASMHGCAGSYPRAALSERRPIRSFAILRFLPVALLGLLIHACAPATPARAPAPPPAAPETPAPALPPIPAVDGPLQLDVAYPREATAIAARDSNFIFGSTGSGRASLTINGTPVEVAPNGGFLAFVPVPPDGVYQLRATRNGQSAELTRTVRVPAPPAAAPSGAAIIPGTIYPMGALALPSGEAFEVGFRGTPGGQAWLETPEGERLPLVEVSASAGAGDAGASFRRTVEAAGEGKRTVSMYNRSVVVSIDWISADTTTASPRLVEGVWRGYAGPTPLTTPPTARFVLVVGSDTARAELPLNLVVLTPENPRVGEAWPSGGAPPDDWTIRGRPHTSGPYHYFWPAGTRLHIDAERNGMFRVRLSETLAGWVPAGDVRLLPSGTPLPRGTVPVSRMRHEPEWVDLRVATPERLPFHVTEGERGLTLDVFGATSTMNFFQYGGLDPLIERAGWEQPAERVLRLDVSLTERVWGWEAFYDANDALVLRIRRPPAIDPERPLAGKVIVVDAGHGGADSTTVGPTRLTEANANLMVALELAPMLEAAGAHVVMTRTDRTGVDLADRPRIARDSNAHAIVSLHNNAFPDGVNPFENNGTSVYYYQPHSADMARLFQRELLAELGLRDIGYGRADLALARPSWMPAVLTETLFMMMPQQEAALRDPNVQERIARAHLRALEAFFRSRAQN